MGLTILPEYAALESKDKINRSRGAYTIGGEKYRSVTTILNATVPKPALMYWAVKVTIAALEDGKSLEEARGENRRISSESAALGTAVHKAIQDHFEGRKPKLTPEIEPAFNAALDFLVGCGLTVVECERPVWHPTQKYAGVVDMICEDKDGFLVCIDWKLAKAIYPEHHFQVAAYAQCVRALTHHLVDSAYVVALPKEGSSGMIKPVDIPAAYEVFTALCEADKVVQGYAG